jgi:hypothetical protein
MGIEGIHDPRFHRDQRELAIAKLFRGRFSPGGMQRNISAAPTLAVISSSTAWGAERQDGDGWAKRTGLFWVPGARSISATISFERRPVADISAARFNIASSI